MNWKIPLSNLDYDETEEQAALDVLRSRWLTMGERTQQFEQEFAAFLGVPHAVAVSNGTTALHLACLAANLQPGDEVILPALTFVATAAAVRYTGATPVFADITSLDDLTLSPADVEKHLTSHTRAILVMHYGGYLCDMPAFETLAQKHGLKLLEDAAHAPGASLHGRAAGAWGLAAAFSFFSNKNLAVGEGGMLTTADQTLAEKLRHLRSHGMTTLTWDRHRGHAWSYDVSGLGYNYRPTEISSALGLAQLHKLESGNQKRRDLTALYHRLLREQIPQVGLPFQAHPGVSACHLLPILLPPGKQRPAFMESMKRRGIQTSFHYPPIPQFSAYGSHSLADLPFTRQIAEREVTLPLYPTLTFEQVQEVVQAVGESLMEQV